RDFAEAYFSGEIRCLHRHCAEMIFPSIEVLVEHHRSKEMREEEHVFGTWSSMPAPEHMRTVIEGSTAEADADFAKTMAYHGRRIPQNKPNVAPVVGWLSIGADEMEGAP